MPLSDIATMEVKNPPALRKSPVVFVAGLVLLIVLWLPPLPWSLRPEALPGWLLAAVRLFREIKPDAVWRLRADYFVIPPLAIGALLVAWRSRVSLADSGLGLAHFGRALRWLALPTLIGMAALFAIGAACGSIQITDRFWKRALMSHAILQQAGIQLFFHRQLMAWFGPGRKTAGLLALYFVLLHAPNPGLMLGTLIGMYFWARCYQLHPNLYALHCSHALLSAVLMHTLPKWLLPSVSVGSRFVEKGIANQWWGWGG